MQISGGGAGNVGSSSITDGAIIDADVNAAAAIAQSKIAAGLNGNTDLFTIETSNGLSHSLTTLANQRVMVLALGTAQGGGNSDVTTNLKYNGVTKHSVTTKSPNSDYPCGVALGYTEVPGAGTQTILVDGGMNSGSCKIFVIKFKSA